MRETFFEYKWLCKQITEFINECLESITNERVESVLFDLEENFWVKFSTGEEVKICTEFKFSKARLTEMGVVINALSNNCIRILIGGINNAE